MPFQLYVANDGSTYYDEALTQLAQAVLSCPISAPEQCTTCEILKEVYENCDLNTYNDSRTYLSINYPQEYSRWGGAGNPVCTALVQAIVHFTSVPSNAEIWRGGSPMGQATPHTLTSDVAIDETFYITYTGYVAGQVPVVCALGEEKTYHRVLTPILVPEGEADITNITAPSEATAGDPVAITANVNNIGDDDFMFASLVDDDTGIEIDYVIGYAPSGLTLPFEFTPDMPNKIWNLRVDAGHQE